ncbi:hypothetical protein N7G274_008222 [Stereocaulon virgatum]|uniref:Uncharacterized protein n=1 Tax=Stereocaulon virgatum TaxID=373712 RepID=A0ABR4A778_9LECA
MAAWPPLTSEFREVYIITCHLMYELSHGNDHSCRGIYRLKDQARQVREDWSRVQIHARPNIYNPHVEIPQHNEYAALDWVIIATKVDV